MKTMKLILIVVMAFTFVILFTSCNEFEPDGNWTLSSIETNEEFLSVADETLPNAISMFLTKGEENAYAISGFAGVNTYVGSTEVVKNDVVVNPLAVTRMLGKENVQNVEDIYLDILQAGGKISIKEGEDTVLVLKNSKNKTSLEFKKTLLENTSWNLVMYNVKDAVTNIPLAGENAYIGFAADGSIHGNTGTNQIMGTFEYTKDGALKLGPMGMTKMAASDEEAYHFEVRLMELYEQVSAFSISGSQLTLSNDAGETLLVFKR